MTRRLLIEQLAKARAIGDHAAEIMLLARIKKEAAADTAAAPSGCPERPLRLVGLSELELRWLHGDR